MKNGAGKFISALTECIAKERMTENAIFMYKTGASGQAMFHTAPSKLIVSLYSLML